MADRVRFILDRMAVLFQQLEKQRIFSSDEIRSIIKKTTDFEYHILRSEVTVREYEEYLQYELHLDELREIRTKKLLHDDMRKEELNQFRVIRSSFIQHIHYIYQRAVRRFTNAIHLWESHISFLQSKESFRYLDATLGKAIALFPKNIDFWIKAATTEIEQRQNFHAARIFLHRALRVNQHHPKLWVKYFEIEIWNVMKIAESRKLSQNSRTDEKQDSDDVKWKEELQKPLLIVFHHACQALFSTSKVNSKTTSFVSSSKGELADADHSDHGVEEEEEEEEEDFSVAIATEEDIPTENFESVFRMHYLFLDLSIYLSSFDYLGKAQDFLLNRFSSYSAIWKHLLKFNTVLAIHNTILPLSGDFVASSSFDESQVNFAQQTALQPQKKRAIAATLEKILSLLQTHKDLIILCELKNKNQRLSVINELLELGVTILNHFLWEEYQRSLFEEHESPSDSFKEFWNKQMAIVQSWMLKPMHLPPDERNFLSLQRFIVDNISKKFLSNFQTSIVKDWLRKWVRPTLQGQSDFIEMSSLTVNAVKLFLSSIHCYGFLSILNYKKLGEEFLSSDDLFLHLSSLINNFTYLTERIEKGLSLDWIKFLSHPQFYEILSSFAAIVQRVAFYKSLHHSAWVLFLKKHGPSFQILSTLLVLKDETKSLLDNLLLWYAESDLSESVCIKSPHADTAVGDPDDLMLATAKSWSQSIFRKIVLSIHVVPNHIRQDILSLSLLTFFKDITRQKDERSVLYDDLQSFENYFFEYWDLFMKYPQLFSNGSIIGFAQGFINLFHSLIQRADDHSIFSETVSSRKRKWESELSPPDRILLKILHRTSDYWSITQTNERPEKEKKSISENPFATRLNQLSRADDKAKAAIQLKNKKRKFLKVLNVGQ